MRSSGLGPSSIVSGGAAGGASLAVAMCAKASDIARSCPMPVHVSYLPIRGRWPMLSPKAVS
eukprot:1721471-Prymnesium_polylepis.1